MVIMIEIKASKFELKGAWGSYTSHPHLSPPSTHHAPLQSTQTEGLAEFVECLKGFPGRSRRRRDRAYTYDWFFVLSIVSIVLLISHLGYLVRTTSENWTLIRDVCDCATASESNAKEAICAVWRELK